MWLVMALAITAGSVLALRGTPGWRPAWAVAVIALAASTPRGGQPGWPDAGGQLGVGECRLDGRACAAPPPVRRACVVPRRRGPGHPGRARCGTGCTAPTWPGSSPCWPGRPAPRWPSPPGSGRWTPPPARPPRRRRASTPRASGRHRADHPGRPHARWLALQENAVPLIAELAAGTADPGHAQVRIRVRGPGGPAAPAAGRGR